MAYALGGIVACVPVTPSVSPPIDEGPPPNEIHGIVRLPNLFGHDFLSYSHIEPVLPGSGIDGSKRKPILEVYDPEWGWHVSWWPSGRGNDQVIRGSKWNDKLGFVQKQPWQVVVPRLREIGQRVLGERFQPLDVEIILVSPATSVRRVERRYSREAIPLRFYFSLPESEGKASEWFRDLLQTVLHEYAHAIASLPANGDLGARHGARSEALANLFSTCAMASILLDESTGDRLPRIRVRVGGQLLSPEDDAEELRQVALANGVREKDYWYLEATLWAARQISEALGDDAGGDEVERRNRVLKACRQAYSSQQITEAP